MLRGSLNAAEFAGRHAHGRAEGPGESAVVIETTFQRDLGDRSVGFAQPTRGHLQTCSGDELARGEIEEPADEPGQL